MSTVTDAIRDISTNTTQFDSVVRGIDALGNGIKTVDLSGLTLLVTALLGVGLGSKVLQRPFEKDSPAECPPAEGEADTPPQDASPKN